MLEKKIFPSIHHLGAKEDLRWAEEYVAKSVGSGRVVYACVRPTEDQVVAYTRSNLWPVMLPCFWIHALLCFPCLVYGCFYLNKRGRHLIYIVTNREVISVLRDFGDPACSCCSSGTDNQVIPYRQISSVSLNQRGKGCTSFKVSTVRVQSTGATFTPNGQATGGVLYMIVPDPDALVKLINDLREATEMHPPNYSATATPDRVAEMRCFVALNGDLSSKKVIKIYPQMSTQQLFDEISLKFNQSQMKYRLELLVSDRERVLIDGPADLSANDVVIAHSY